MILSSCSKINVFQPLCHKTTHPSFSGTFLDRVLGVVANRTNVMSIGSPENPSKVGYKPVKKFSSPIADAEVNSFIPNDEI